MNTASLARAGREARLFFSDFWIKQAAKTFLFDPEILPFFLPLKLCWRTIWFTFYRQERWKVVRFFQERAYQKEFGPARIFLFGHGTFVGRRFTMDAAKAKAFIVDTKATMLRRNSELSKHARDLYLAMRSRADGKTGELKIKGRWLKASVFDRAAEMCRDIRLPAMRELIAAGLASMKRPRVWREIGGRIRAVAGPTEYRVFKEPIPPEASKTHQKAKDSSKVDLQESIPSTVEEIDRQYLSKPPFGASIEAPKGFGVENFEIGAGALLPSSSSKAPATDDDDGKSEIPSTQTPATQTGNSTAPVEQRTKLSPAQRS